MNNQQQDFEKLFRQELEKVEFANQDLKEVFPFFKDVLQKTSLASLECDAQTYKSIAIELYKEIPEFNLYNASFVINNLTRKSPTDLGVTIGEYASIILVVDELSTKWNEAATPIRTKLVNKLRTQQALQTPNNGMNVIPGKGR